MKTERTETAALSTRTDETAATRVDAQDDRPAVGSWWGVKYGGDQGEGVGDPEWFGGAVEVGSNYVVLEGIGRKDQETTLTLRVHMDHFAERCRSVVDPASVISAQVDQSKHAVRHLMGQIAQACARLGVSVQQALGEASDPGTTALAVAHGTADVRAYSQALTKLKDDELPQLFEQVKVQHSRMATWMRADLIPAKAELARVQGVTKVVEQKIETVELYAGLDEEAVLVRNGDPAPVAARVHLMQRMHFMDEECLARYEAGGMDFEDVAAFDRWLCRSENLSRILPHPRCVVAFRVRRHRKQYDSDLSPFIRMRFDNENKRTCLYVRNGDRVHRVFCALEFGEQLFPRREEADLLGDDEIWVRWQSGNDAEFITGRKRAAAVEKERRGRARLAFRLKAWRKAGQPRGDWSRPLMENEKRSVPYRVGIGRMEIPEGSTHEHGKPSDWNDNFHRRHDDVGNPDDYVLLTPEHAFYEDAMRRVRDQANQHNRVAVVVQGLLDRSTCLHPHPPWKVWTPEGFSQGVELVYDVSLAIAPGEAPDFEEYRKQLNKSLRTGCHTVGQVEAWHDERPSYKDLNYHPKRLLYLSGGPKRVHQVKKISRDGKKVTFSWERERHKPHWIPHPEKPGYRKATYPGIPIEWSCDREHLTCVEAYTPGDFHLFYDDPRTRADYLKWAPILLACEDWHKRRRDGDPPDDEKDDEECPTSPLIHIRL